MSATEVTCPTCATRLQLPPDNTATRFRCTQCTTVFDGAVEPPPAPVVEPPAPVPAPALVPMPVAVPAAAFEFGDDETMADEPAPEPRGRRRRAEADDEPPARRSPKRDSGGLKVLLACGGVLALVAAAVGGYFALRDPAKPVVKADPVPVTPPKQTGPKVAPVLTVEQVIKKVKASTVYIRNTARTGEQSSGTGFFAVKPGFVVTNAHVVGYGPTELSVPAKLEVVLNSGENGERTLPATIYGLDADLDLALLKVDGTELPPLLTLGKSDDLTEAQEVVAFGFPFGESLGKSMTVSPTRVSSLRKENGLLTKVQLTGGLNPGNSGGPVTDQKGEVIGVSVSKLRNTDIAFAIPAAAADRFADDQFARGGMMRLGAIADLSPDELDGQYLLIGADRKGQKLTDADLKKLSAPERTVFIKGNRFATFTKAGRPEVASVAVDAAQKPARFDIISSKDGKPAVEYGIYKLENGLLTICSTDTGEEKDRPKEFAPGAAVTVLTLRKQTSR